MFGFGSESNKNQGIELTLGHIPGKDENSSLKRNMHPIFTAAQLTIAKTWKQPKSPLTDEWMRKMGHMSAMEYYSAIKRAKKPFAATWWDLENIRLSEMSEKDKYMISLTCGI